MLMMMINMLMLHPFSSSPPTRLYYTLVHRYNMFIVEVLVVHFLSNLHAVAQRKCMDFKGTSLSGVKVEFYVFVYAFV